MGGGIFCLLDCVTRRSEKLGFVKKNWFRHKLVRNVCTSRKNCLSTFVPVGSFLFILEIMHVVNSLNSHYCFPTVDFR